MYPGFPAASKQVNTSVIRTYTAIQVPRGGGGVQAACTEPSWLSQRGFVLTRVVSSPCHPLYLNIILRTPFTLYVNVRDVHAVESVEFE